MKDCFLNFQGTHSERVAFDKTALPDGKKWIETDTGDRYNLVNGSWQIEAGGGGGGTPADTVAELDGSGNAGDATAYSRGNHKHGDTSRHGHGNKSTLDSYDQTNVNLSEAVSKKHSNSLDHSNINDPTSDQKAALTGTNGTPSISNKYVTATDPTNTNERTPTGHSHLESDISGLAGDLSSKENLSNKGVASGYAGLDTATKVPTVQLGGAGADSTKYLRGDQTWQVPAGGGSDYPWEGILHVAWASGDPSMDVILWAFQNTVVSVAGPTPTGIGTTIGRLVYFKFKKAIVAARIRYFGLATVSSLYTLAFYNASSLARVWMSDPLNVVVGWQTVTAGFPVTFAAGQGYWMGLGAKSTGTTSGFRSPASPIASSLGLAAIPGNLANFGLRFAQVALTAGAWPATLPTLADAVFASAGATGTLPIAFLDNA